MSRWNRGITAVAIAVSVLVSVSVMAGEHHKKDKAPKSASSAAEHLASGTITAWDDASKQVTVKTAGGAEETFEWTDKTELNGTPKVGELAHVEYTKDKGGKVWATEISIGKRRKEHSKA